MVHTSHVKHATYSLHINIYFMVQNIHKHDFNSCIISDYFLLLALKLLLNFTRLNKAVMNGQEHSDFCIQFYLLRLQIPAMDQRVKALINTANSCL